MGPLSLLPGGDGDDGQLFSPGMRNSLLRRSFNVSTGARHASPGVEGDVDTPLSKLASHKLSIPTLTEPAKELSGSVKVKKTTTLPNSFRDQPGLLMPTGFSHYSKPRSASDRGTPRRKQGGGGEGKGGGAASSNALVARGGSSGSPFPPSPKLRSHAKSHSMGSK